MTTTAQNIPMVGVPRHLREQLAAFFEKDAAGLRAETKEAWAPGYARWAERAAGEAKGGRLILHDDRDQDGDRLADYLAGAVENLTTVRGTFDDLGREESLFLEADLLTLAGEIVMGDTPSSRTWARHGKQITEALRKGRAA